MCNVNVYELYVYYMCAYTANNFVYYTFIDVFIIQKLLFQEIEKLI